MTSKQHIHFAKRAIRQSARTMKRYRDGGPLEMLELSNEWTRKVQSHLAQARYQAVKERGYD